MKAIILDTLRQTSAVLEAKPPDDAAGFKAWLREPASPTTNSEMSRQVASDLWSKLTSIWFAVATLTKRSTNASSDILEADGSRLRASVTAVCVETT